MQHLVLREDKTKYELRIERRYHLKVIRWVCRIAIWEDPNQLKADPKPSIPQPQPQSFE
jgi:hypothetical protein